MTELAPCSWIDDAPRTEVESLFVWVRPDAPMLPPDPPRGRDHPSVLLLELPRDAYTDADLRIAGRLARHLTALSDMSSTRQHGAYAMIQPIGGQWMAGRLSWTRGMARIEMADAADLLVVGSSEDLDSLAPYLEAFDAEAGHPAASPSP